MQPAVHFTPPVIAKVMTVFAVAVIVSSGLVVAASSRDASAVDRVATPWPVGEECLDSLRRDLGDEVTVIDGLCLDGWAYVDLCGSCGGDTQQVVRFGTDGWDSAVAFPTPMCRSDALAMGMPVLILDRIVWQCDGGAPRPAPVADEFPLRVGSSGPRVAELQSGLQALGFDVGASGADGHFGPDTERAVRDWQASAGLPGTGAVYQPSFELIVAGAAPATVPAGAVDPANMRLPAGVCPAWYPESDQPVDADRSPAIAISDGVGSTHDDTTAAGYAYAEVRTDGVQFVDVDGDGTVETVVIVVCTWGGSGSAFTTPVVTLRHTAEGVVELAAEPIRYHAGGELANQAALRLRFEGETLVVDGDEWLAADPSCCPSLTFSARWDFADRAWVEA